MRRIAIVTTFSKAGWEQYGKRMVDSFERMWPPEADLFLFPDCPIDQPKSHRIYVPAFKIKERDAFVKKWKGVPNANGQADGPYNYRYDAVKFCHKPFVLHHFATYINKQIFPAYDAMIWFDADSLTHTRVSLKAMLEQFAPVEKDLQYLGRSYKYSECGYMAFNLRNRLTETFLTKWTDFYRNGTFKDQKEWHDSWLFDRAREQMSVQHPDYVQHSLTSHLPRRQGAGHPFVSSFLGEYMDHLKGVARKATGKPRPNDLMVDHKAKYWSENAQRYKNKPKPSRR